MTVINSRTRGPAPMMMGNLNDEASDNDASSDKLVEGEDGEFYRFEIRNGMKVFTKPWYDATKGSTKGGGKGRTDKECFRCGRICLLGADCRAKTHPNEGPTKSAPKGKGVGSCQEDEQETSQSADHGDTAENDTVVDEFSEDATFTMPPLPLAPLFKKTRTSKYTEMHCKRLLKQCHGNDYRDGEESSLFDCWDEQSGIFQQVDPWAQNALKSVSCAEGCLSVNFTVCSVSKSWVCTANSCQLQLTRWS